MEFYVISPVSNLSPMKLGDRIFVLAHLWVQFPFYRNFILKRKALGAFITLDNSAAERALVTEDILINICHELMPDEVIAPDVLFDKEATLDNAIQFVKRMETEGLLGKINIFFCPQGNTREEWLEAYKFGLGQSWIDVIGLSKIAVPRAWLEDNTSDDQGIMEARHICYDYLLRKDLLKKPIHCLGQGNPNEFKHYRHPMMRSTDSVYPVLAAVHNIDFTEDATTRVPTPHNFLESYDMSDVNMDLIYSNVNYLRDCCNIGVF